MSGGDYLFRCPRTKAVMGRVMGGLPPGEATCQQHQSIPHLMLLRPRPRLHTHIPLLRTLHPTRGLLSGVPWEVGLASDCKAVWASRGWGGVGWGAALDEGLCQGGGFPNTGKSWNGQNDDTHPLHRLLQIQCCIRLQANVHHLWSPPLSFSALEAGDAAV